MFFMIVFIEWFCILVCIIVFNEVGCIGDCLVLLVFCDEIVVVDFYFIDVIVVIVEVVGVCVLQCLFDGFCSQKVYCVEQVGYDWVLCLDVDEWISLELCVVIEQVCDGGFVGYVGYCFVCLLEYFGKFLCYGNVYLDWVMCLFDCCCGGWCGKCEIYEVVSVDGSVGILCGDLVYYFYCFLQ